MVQAILDRVANSIRISANMSRPLTLKIFWHRCPAASVRPGFQAHSISSGRYFSLSTPRCKLSSTAPKPPKAPSQRPAPARPAEKSLPFTGRRPPGLLKLASKVAKEGKLELYKAPSHRAYILSAYGLSAFCFAYSIYNSYVIFQDPIGPLPMWQKVLFGGVCVMTSVMGTLFFTRTSNLIKNVTAINSKGRIQLDFTVRHMVPFRKPYQFEVLPEQVKFKRRLVVSPESIKRYEKDQVRIGADQGPPPRFFRAPVKTVNFSLWRVFHSLRQVFSSEDFIMLEVQGQKGTFRLDANGLVAQELFLIGDPLSIRK